MTFTDRVSWWTVGVRSLVLAILVVGIAFQRPSLAIFLGALAYAVAEAGRLYVLSQPSDASIANLATASRSVLRRGSLWTLIVGAVLFDLLVTQSFLVALASVTLVYVAELCSQSARRHAEEADRNGPTVV
jgi:predicted transcriptional regulator